MSLNLPTGA